jgi:hypothetical protein
LSGLLFTAAAFTNPRYVLAAPLTAFVWLWRQAQRREALRLAAILIGSFLALFLSLNLITGGGFYLNTVLANLTTFSWDTVTGYLLNLYLNAGFLVIGCLLYIILERMAETTRSWPLVVSYGLGAACMTLTTGMPNATAGDLFEVVAALCLASGAFIAWAGENYWLKALLVFMLALQINALIEWSRQDVIPELMTKVTDRRGIERLAQYVREAGDPILAGEYMGLIPLAGRRLYFQPLEYKQLQAADLWDEAPFLDSIERQEFSLILLYEPRNRSAISIRWSEAVRKAIYAHYSLEDTLARNFVYRPKK